MPSKKTTYIVELQADMERLRQQASELEPVELFKMDDKTRKELESTIAQQLKINEEVEKLQEGLEGLKDFKGPQFNEMRKQLELALRERGQSPYQQDIKKFLGDVKKKIFDTVKGLAEDIFEQAKEMMDEIASYSENSMMFSEKALDLRMSYGLTGAQAYAYQKAAEDVGFGDFEGYIENAAFASKETLDRFDELLNLYQTTYEQDKETAEAYQRFQAEFKDFKTKMASSLIDFFMDNKDTIMSLLQGAVGLLEGIMQFVGWLVDRFNAGRERTTYERQSSLSDIYNSYGGSKTTNIKIDNSFTGVSPRDRQTYTNAGELTYRQIIDSFR